MEANYRGKNYNFKFKLTPKFAVFSVVRSGVGDKGEPNWTLACVLVALSQPKGV